MYKKTLIPKYNNDNNNIEIGVDEAGRGPMFGRVYTASVILPNDNFDFSLMKDSKKFTSKKKIMEAYDYIINNALAWSVNWLDERTIDKINIRQSTLTSMHNSIHDIIDKYKIQYNNEINDRNKFFLLIDGNDFKPYMIFENDEYKCIDYTCIKGGDNTYCSIAAASILAKVERDRYIEELCDKNPELQEKYKIRSNKGYGTKFHMDGIKKYGITQWHRKTYGICKMYA